jgi:hypothetical protein
MKWNVSDLLLKIDEQDVASPQSDLTHRVYFSAGCATKSTIGGSGHQMNG